MRVRLEHLDVTVKTSRGQWRF